MDKTSVAQALRQQAEAIIRDKASLTNSLPETMTVAGMQRTVFELQVHQIELEMQNDELRRTQLLLETARNRYFELFDLAPVGYCTVSESGLVLEANIAAATLMGIGRSALMGQHISRFIGRDYQDTYFRLREQLLNTGTPQTCELEIVGSDGHPCWVQMSASAAQDATGAPEQHLVLDDISDAKVMATAMQASEARYRALLDSSAERKLQDGIK